MSSFSLDIREELALIRTFMWHTRKSESGLRRKMVSLQTKMEQARGQLRGVLKFMKQHQNGIDVHLKKLSKTEHTLREQIDNIFIEKSHRSPSSSISSRDRNHRPRNNSKHKSTKRAKKLNSDLIEIVQHRNDLEQRDSASESTRKVIESLLNDETRPFGVEESDAMGRLLEELDDNVSPAVEEYLNLRQQMHRVQEKLVDCVERRERLCQTERETVQSLKRHIPRKLCGAGRCECDCIHRDSILIDDDGDGDDPVVYKERANSLSGEELREQLILLGQDIFTRSGLIRKHHRDGMCLLRVFVGSELITWMVRSKIVSTRYEASILSSLLIKHGYIYCAYSSGPPASSAPKGVSKNPSIVIKTPSVHFESTKRPRSLQSKNPSSLLCGSPCSSTLSLPSSSALLPQRPSASSSVVSASSAASTTSSTFTNRSSSRSASMALPEDFDGTLESECKCQCAYCLESNGAIDLAFDDTNCCLYRFRCDDQRIERISKMGWLDKVSRFRSRRRFWIWDGVGRQLREYRQRGDSVPLCKYAFSKETKVTPSPTEHCVLFIRSRGQTLTLKAASKRERSGWLRVLKQGHEDDDGGKEDVANDAETGDQDNGPTDCQMSGEEQYEQFRHFRMTNRLKWSLLFGTMRPDDAIHEFRTFVAEQCSMRSAASRTEIARKVDELFLSNGSSIDALFASFHSLFLEPFEKINAGDLDMESVESIIALSREDLQSFLDLSQCRLHQILIPAAIRSAAVSGKQPAVIKVVRTLIADKISDLTFSSNVYSKVFPLYQRVHRDADRQVLELSRRARPLDTSHYHISEELQIDIEWFQLHGQCADKTSLRRKQRGAFKLLLATPVRTASDRESTPSVVSSSTSHSDGHSSSLSLGSIPCFNGLRSSTFSVDLAALTQCESPRTSLQSQSRSQSQSQSQSQSHLQSGPFVECIEQFAKMSRARSPGRKLRCLVEVQQLLIKCIDRHRNRCGDSSEPAVGHLEEKEVEGEDDEMSIESLDYASDRGPCGQSGGNTRGHGIMTADEDDEEDEAVSLVSYESIASEYWTQRSQCLPKSKTGTKPKCKQLLIASDDILPFFCYLLVQSQVECVNAEMAFMNDFMSDDEKQKKAGFYLTTLQAATSALRANKLPDFAVSR